MATKKKSTKSSKKPSTSKKPAPKTVNKSAWIRSQPADLPAKEVVAKAKAAGITVSEGMVYTTRSQAKKKGAAAAPKKLGRPPKGASVASAPSNAEQTIRRLSLQIGIVAVEAIVKKIKAEAGL